MEKSCRSTARIQAKLWAKLTLVAIALTHQTVPAGATKIPDASPICPNPGQCFINRQAQINWAAIQNCELPENECSKSYEEILVEAFDALASEGITTYVYLDSVGKPTVGRGRLITSRADALSLPFLRRDGTPASDKEILDMLAAVQSHPQSEACLLGDPTECYPASYYSRFTELRLDKDFIDAEAMRYMVAFGEDLQNIYPDFYTYPGDVKKALFDMIYNLGPYKLEFVFKSFTKAIRDRNWKEAAVQSYRYQLSQERNDYVRKLLENVDAKSCPVANQE